MFTCSSIICFLKKRRWFTWLCHEYSVDCFLIIIVLLGLLCFLWVHTNSLFNVSQPTIHLKVHIQWLCFQVFFILFFFKYSFSDNQQHSNTFSSSFVSIFTEVNREIGENKVYFWCFSATRMCAQLHWRNRDVQSGPLVSPPKPCLFLCIIPLWFPLSSVRLYMFLYSCSVFPPRAFPCNKLPCVLPYKFLLLGPVFVYPDTCFDRSMFLPEHV